MPEHNGPEIETEQTSVSELLTGSTALEAVDRAQIDIQVATAKEYPRSVDKSLKQALTLATLDEETAASMFYALPRGGKTIEGPSARLAEIMAYSWGNLRADADIVAEDKTHVTAMGTCFDLEKNVAVRVRVKRRITDKYGKRYNEDMIGVTSNATISIALRNAVFKVIPAALVQRVYRKARLASIGEAGTMEQKRQNAVAWFGKLGVQPEEVFETLGVQGLADIGEDELITLRGLRTALQDGETTVQDAFNRDGSRQAGQATKERVDELRQQLDQVREEEEKEKAEPAEPHEEAGPDHEIVEDEEDGEPTEYQLWKRAYQRECQSSGLEGDARLLWQEEHIGERSQAKWSTDDFRKAAEMLSEGIGLDAHGSVVVGSGEQDEPEPGVETDSTEEGPEEEEAVEEAAARARDGELAF